MDIIDLIKQEHQKITNLLAEMCNADVQKRYTLFNELSQAIELLTEVKQHFYPLLRQRCTDIIEQIAIAEDQYDHLKFLIAELELLSPATKEFEQKVYDLQKLVRLYIQEEDKVLGEASKRLTNAQRQQLSYDGKR
ncbi:hemerythrin domain-containing protein [Chroogloeocystis siderophila]|uniref:Hemerythrin-like domain-containing protein n=1 Tax=Chroogloeocystis siderophila 5.2 s.c.1 TaxID=247279 RepID=A0A1U7HU78_9CHRO|nr:hemerythrin domain-containing protein [Chroogloeocystis siderophila]OKH27088.1 hypothetical protein NIES1031_10245 [Chroogloeocystis siderophila 5.2 s.c.1]